MSTAASSLLKTKELYSHLRPTSSYSSDLWWCVRVQSRCSSQPWCKSRTPIEEGHRWSRHSFCCRGVPGTRTGSPTRPGSGSLPAILCLTEKKNKTLYQLFIQLLVKTNCSNNNYLYRICLYGIIIHDKLLRLL